MLEGNKICLVHFHVAVSLVAALCQVPLFDKAGWLLLPKDTVLTTEDSFCSAAAPPATNNNSQFTKLSDAPDVSTVKLLV